MNSRTAMEVLRYESILPTKYKNLWSDWEIRVFVLGSLALQVCLIILAPNRKIRPSRRIRFVIWSCYLLADAVANFALGHLADNQSDSGSPSSPGGAKNHISAGFERVHHYYHSLSHRGGGGGGGGAGGQGQGGSFNSNVLAFWAPFLLLHLGGPDTITAFSLEDNELWLRHLLGLFFQLFGCGYVLFRSLPHNSMLAPTLVMLLVGTIKYGERTYSLFLGSAEGFRDSILTDPDPGPMYFKFMDEYQAKKDAGLDPEIEIVRENEIKFGDDGEDVEAGGGGQQHQDGRAGTKQKKLDDVGTVLEAFNFFNIYKCLVVDLVLTYEERKKSRRFFLQRSPEDAFRVISVELNFLYDVLYTKALVVRKQYWGLALRATCTASIAASFLIFAFFNKEGFHPVDVWITYALLIGAVALDVLGFFLLVFSDWTLLSLGHTTLGSWLGRVVARPGKKRWSEVVWQLDLIGCCLQLVPRGKLWCLRRFTAWLEKVGGWLCFLRPFLEEVTYTDRQLLHSHLPGVIFQELKLKSEDATDLKTTKKLIERRGLHVLENHRIVMKGEDDPLQRSVEVEFDECVLLWHIATALCYHQETEKNTENNGGAGEAPSTVDVAGDSKVISYRKLSRQLSEYMMYLLVMQPALMSAMGGIGLLRYRDTCKEARLLFDTSGEVLNWHDGCTMLLSVATEAKPSDVKGDRSKSVLFDGCILAKRLLEMEASSVDEKPGDGAYARAARDFMNRGGKLGSEQRWEVITKVWVELLSYAACHCRGSDHARKLSTGGELLNLVWLLMAQLGLGEQFRTETGQAWAKLVFNK